MRLTIPWETVALGTTLYSAVAFDIASVSTLYNDLGWLHLLIYLIFFILQILATLWYVWLILRRRSIVNHVFHIESARDTELYTAALAFVAFAIADFSELLIYISDAILVMIAIKMIFSSFAFVFSLFGLIISIVARQNRLSRLATSLDVKPVNNLPLIKLTSKRAQRRDMILLLTIFWWFMADIVELIHYDSKENNVGVYILTAIVVAIFFVLTTLTIFLDAALEMSRAELRTFEIHEHL